jgi:nucleoside diphosphate kinase homolog 5
LRALYGTDGTHNATHGSDSPASAQREIKFFFPQLVLDDQVERVNGEQYILEQLQPTLLKGLTALAKDKPTAEKFEAITWLAQWVLKNNPNKAKMFTPDQWVPPVDEEEDEIEALEREQRAAAGRTEQLVQAVAGADGSRCAQRMGG